MRQRWLLVLLLVLSAISGYLLFWRLFNQTGSEPDSYLIINNTQIQVEVAQNPNAISKGLSGRLSMPEGEGMLFILDTSDYHQFWMKEMQFSLDFIFIQDNLVVDIAQNIPYPQGREPPVSLTARKPFNKVLELNAGMIARLGVKVGNQVQFFLSNL